MLSIVKDVFCIYVYFFLWKKVIGLGVVLGFFVLIGVLVGYMDYGLIVSIGGFVYLYVGGELYKKCVLKLFLVFIGIVFLFGLGIFLFGMVWMMVVVLGLIGVVVMFIFSVFGI